MPEFNRRNLVLASSIIAFSFASAVPGSAQGAAKSPAKPNIVIFLADYLSYSTVPPVGDGNVRTTPPHRLATAGLSSDSRLVPFPPPPPTRAARPPAQRTTLPRERDN